MNVRKLTSPSDWLESERVLATAFLHPWDEETESAKVREQIEGTVPRPEVSWGLFGSDGTMLTSISTVQHQLAFGGQAIQAGEVHMVGSLPERRGGGGVRTLMAELLRDFRTQGDALAVLIPFSCAFYRKFGFEVASRTVRQRLAIDQLADFACNLRVTRVWEEGDLEVVRTLWHSFALAHDLTNLRDDGAWTWHGNGDFGAPDFFHPERQRYAYVLWDGDEACAYLRFAFFHEPEDPFVGELEVTDFVYSNPAALNAALGFLYRMRAKVSHVNISLPDVELAQLVPEPNKVEQRIDCHAMARVLDANRLMLLMPQPHGKGSYTLGINDSFLPELGGTLRIAFKDGRTVSVTHTDLAPDLLVDETVACQLILGRISFADALFRQGVQVSGNTETLARAFVRRAVHLSLD